MDAKPDTVRATGIATAVIPWLVVAVLCALFMLDVMGRYLLRQPLSYDIIDAALRITGGLMIVALCVAMFDVLAGLFENRAAGSADHSTRLAHWPGLPLAFLGAVVGLALLALQLRGSLQVLAAPMAALGDYGTSTLLFAVAAPAIVAPTRLRGTLALMGLPFAGLALLAMIWEVSLAKATFQLLVVLVPIGILLLVAGLVTGVAHLVWGGASCLILLFIFAPIMAGLMTPAEAAAVATFVALVVGVILQGAQGSDSLKQAFVDGGREMAAVAAIVLMCFAVSRLLAVLGWNQTLAAAASNMPWPFAAALLVVIVAALSYVATPMLAIGLCGVLFGPVVGVAGFDVGKAAVLIVVAAMMTAILRIVPATAGAERRLSYSAAGAIVAGSLIFATGVLALVRLPDLF